jgi:GDP/UDP-N,N'-diacetylbacillosamine 2-epimerase (hydrolysing)
MSVNEIRSDGFEVSDEIYMAVDGYNHYTHAKALGVFLCSFTDVVMRTRPDWIVLAGDRGEQLIGGVVGAYTYTPVAHIQAGELSGNIDGVARHALGKFAHLHMAANQDAADRLQRLGEQEFRIHNVGAPQLDELEQRLYSDLNELESKHAIDLSRPYMLVVQHAVTEEYDQAAKQIQATVEAIDGFDLPKIWILPNNDAGSNIIRQGILKQRRADVYLFENLKREDYLGFLRGAACMVGNSSSALLEAPSFHTPAVNIGRRQAQRVQGNNVINSSYETDEIIEAIKLALSEQFRESLRDCKNPYGDGHSSERILDILENTRHDDRLLIKELTY